MGGTKGLGRAAAGALARAGASVAVCGRRREDAEAAAEAIRREAGGRALGVAADVTRPADATLSSPGRRRPWAPSTSSSPPPRG